MLGRRMATPRTSAGSALACVCCALLALIVGTYVYVLASVPTGACTLDDGTCTLVSAEHCAQLLGTYAGNDQVCVDDQRR